MQLLLLTSGQSAFIHHGSGQIEGTCCCKHSCSFYKSLEFTGVCWVVLSHRLIAVTSVSIQFNDKMIRCWGHISQIVTISTAKGTSLLGSSSNWNWLVLDIAGSEFGGDNCCLNQPSQCHLVSKTVERGVYSSMYKNYPCAIR